MQKDIIIKGAKEHNLKNIDVTIPRESFTVISGLSGSGKSSLAFDTLYSEGQRRYVESLSAYARQFLGLMEKPDVESIEGLSPAISIEQKTTGHNPRSTVATITEIHDYLRLLYGSVGVPHCYECGREISSQTVQEICDQIMAYPVKSKLQLLTPVIMGKKGEHKELLESLRAQGYIRARIDGEIRLLEEEIELEKKLKHTIEVMIDRLVIKEGIERRLTGSLETALKLSCNGTVIVDEPGSGEKLYSELLACTHCGISFGAIEPRNFSFNSPFGACPSCNGLGYQMTIDPDLVVPDDSKRISTAMVPWAVTGKAATWTRAMLKAVTAHYDIDMAQPWKKLTKKEKKILLYGSGRTVIKSKWHNKPFEGVIPNITRRFSETDSEQIRTWIETFMSKEHCNDCDGQRLSRTSLAVTVGDINIGDLTALSIEDIKAFFDALPAKLSARDKTIAKQILREIDTRISFLYEVGLGYLTLNRMAQTLSGGEAQRIRLATQIGSRLTGVTYILDEPSIGLHPRDNTKLLGTLLALRDLGNTVVVIEHDQETLEAADWLIDIGPRAGKHGGEVVVADIPSKVKEHPTSLTGAYLSGRITIPVPTARRKGNGQFITIKGANGNNLQKVSASFPLGALTVVTGVSGSGKSTLINQTLYPALAKHFYRAKAKPLPYTKIEGLEQVDKVIAIDQSPIGRTPRSNPATYTKLFDPIRDLFASLPESKMRGYSKGRFSFNVKGGRCEACRGDGMNRIEMHFLPDVFVECEECKGKRYNRDTLLVTYKGKSISDVLEMTVDDAHQFFKAVPTLKRKLETLERVGLGYIHLGQPATTLSGGEAQRIKLASELNKIATGQTLYILDEPTTGLHFEDIRMLMEVIQELVDKGNTVIVIEHNLDVMKCADYMIDLGPEGGAKGGLIIATGTPEEVVQNSASETGRYLKELL